MFDAESQLSAEHPDKLVSVAISVVTPERSYRLLRGQRLTQFQEDYFSPTLQSQPEPIGEAALLTADNKAELPSDYFRPWEAISFEIELATLTDRTAPEAEKILSLFFPPDAARDLARLGTRPAQAWSSPTVIEVDEPLRKLGAGAFDLRTAGDYGTGYCTQDVHLIVSEQSLVTLWGQPSYFSVQADSRLSLPGSRSHIHALTEISGWDGPARLARLIQAIIRHHEWASSVLSSKIEDWERRFFALYASKTPVERDAEISKLEAELSILRGFLSAIHIATQTMERRAGNQPSFPRIVQAEALERTRKLEQKLHAQRGEVRESFALLAGAVSEQQVRAINATEARMHSLTILATYATALVLVPGLLIALYGADVTGLPGKGSLLGLIYLGIGSLLGASVTVLVFLRGSTLRALRWRRRRAADTASTKMSGSSGPRQEPHATR